ncbi:carbamoylphosphate synthase large subunit [Solibacillus silvestris StLB046]|uniref:Carbamoylphosphate synthase large subunit n=1 Tax=Solibacillus silvestris (strain StLB046) TaxID=1002809 RepID=F2F2N3_SOLSS|nr:carbamoylphosphate synthase large subunit [Solibacillus silvestris StLB046]
MPENGYDNYEVEAVLNTINRELAHKYIITELMIRTLERDRQHTEAFKMKDVMDKLFEQAIRKAKDELLALKNEMGKIGLRKQDEKKLDDTVTVYYFVQRGISDELRYMNYALRNHTMKEIERLLNIK